MQSFPITATISHDLHRVRYDHKYLSTTLNMPASNGSFPTGIKFRSCAMLPYYLLLQNCFSNFLICRTLFQTEIPYFSIDNAHLMYNAHPKLMSYTSTLVLLLHLIYLSYLSNVYRACSFFTNLDLFCIDNARVIYRIIRYFPEPQPCF